MYNSNLEVKNIYNNSQNLTVQYHVIKKKKKEKNTHNVKIKPNILKNINIISYP